MLPEEYHDILRKHGNLHVYGEDWQSFDFKAATAALCKAQRSFKISEEKVISLDGNNILFKQSYNGVGCVHSLLKKGKKWLNLQPDLLPTQNKVTKAKKDVIKLLELISAPPNIFDFYSAILLKGGYEDDDADND